MTLKREWWVDALYLPAPDFHFPKQPPPWGGGGGGRGGCLKSHNNLVYYIGAGLSGSLFILCEPEDLFPSLSSKQKKSPSETNEGYAEDGQTITSWPRQL